MATTQPADATTISTLSGATAGQALAISYATLAAADLATNRIEVNEMVFVDRSLPDWPVLVEHCRPDASVVLIDPSTDGLQQIQIALRGAIGLRAIHIVSHGAPGYLILGSSRYSVDDLRDQKSALAAIGRSLATDGDLLLYGCEVAQAQTGMEFIRQMAAYTGVKVAASIDRTGGAGVGGNWALEYATGRIETSGFLSDPGVAAYRHSLGVVVLSGSTGWVATMYGAAKDPQGDSQAGAADTDIIASASHGSFYVAFDDNGTVATADDTIQFRLRIDNPTSTSNFGGVGVVGLDANADGKIDLFILVDGRNNGQAVRIMEGV